MLTHLTAHLTGPICRCGEMDLGWSLWINGKSITMTINCKTCLTSINIPYDSLKADFSLKVPYPGKSKPESKPRSQDGECQVIELFPTKDS